MISFLQLCGNVIRDIEGAPGEAGIHGVEAMVAHFSSIDIEFVETCYGDIGPGGADLLCDSESLSEIGGGLKLWVCVVVDAGAPHVAALHHACFETGCHGGCAGFSVFVPCFGPPKQF